MASLSSNIPVSVFKLTMPRAQNARLVAALAQHQERTEAQEAQNAALVARLQRLKAGAARVATLVSR
jgi:hypothetical protein